MDDIKKGKILSWVIVGIIGLIAIGSTFAYLAGKEAVDIDFGASVTTNTVDSLMFTIDNDITITADMSNFTEGLDNREGSTHASAVLKANNKTNSATDHYYLYFDVTNNEFKYTTRTRKPELILQVSGPDGDLGDGDISGLNYKTVVDGQGNEISGFDITNKKGLITIGENLEISTNSTKTDNWDITVIFVNLDDDQTANGGKKFSGKLIAQKDVFGGVIKSVTSDYDGEIWGYRDSIKKIIFETSNNNHDNAAHVFNIEDENSKPVVAYMMDNGDNTYTTYIQSDEKIKANQDSSYLFANFSILESIDGMENFDTSSVTTTSYMFFNCTNLQNVNVNNFDMSQVTDMASMFRNCNSLTSLDVSGWDTSQVTNMSCVFIMCNNLISLNLSGWDTSNVTEMAILFGACNGLTSIGDVSNWDTSQVDNMSSMFKDCDSLTSLDLSGWDTSKVTDMSGMFSGCRSLTSIDFRSATFTSVTKTPSMFYSVPTTIKVMVKDSDAKTFIEKRLASGVGSVEIA